MAKLDKQGLNTFIRELDKHINTKINRLDISPTAEKVTMADGTSVEETVNTNKESITNNTELANQALEKANEAFQRGDEVKNLLVDKLISNNIEVSTNDTFEKIIESISMGKRYAICSGKAGTNTHTLGFTPSTAIALCTNTYCGQGPTSGTKYLEGVNLFLTDGSQLYARGLGNNYTNYITVSITMSTDESTGVTTTSVNVTASGGWYESYKGCTITKIYYFE